MSEKNHALQSWTEEKSSAYLYRAVARAEAGTPRQALFEELAEAAESQAAIWAEVLRKQGQPFLPNSGLPCAQSWLLGLRSISARAPYARSCPP